MPSRVQQLEALLAKEPNDTFLLYALAQEFAKQGDTDAALARFDACLQIDPDFLYAYFHKAKLLAGLGHTGEAVEVARTGFARARAKQDGKAMGELEALIDELT